MLYIRGSDRGQPIEFVVARVLLHCEHVIGNIGHPRPTVVDGIGIERSAVLTTNGGSAAINPVSIISAAGVVALDRR